MMKVASPNWRERKPGAALKYVVIHGTWMADDAAVVERLCDPAAQVSAHYFIDHAGAVTRLVDEDKVAFHAGVSFWEGIENLNDWSLGIEVGNAGPFGETMATVEGEKNPDWSRVEAYGEVQYDALIGLLREIMRRHPQIKPQHVVGHSEIAPGRKSDPGPHFDWGKLAAAGVALRRA